MSIIKHKPLLLGAGLAILGVILGLSGLISHTIQTLIIQGFPAPLLYLGLSLPFLGFLISLIKIIIGININNNLIPISLIGASILIGPVNSVSIFLICLLINYFAKTATNLFHLHVGVKNSLFTSIGSLLLILYLGFCNNTPQTASQSVIYGLITILIINEKFLNFKISKTSLISDLKTIGKTLLLTAIGYLLLGGQLFGWQWLGLQNLIINYPESSLLAILGTFLIGQYTGLRLSEIIRFRKLIFKNH